MSKVMSFRDLKLIPELSGLSEIHMIHPSNDNLVNKYLAQLGFDLDYAVVYIPAKHRDMQGKIAVGFRAVGEVSCNRNFINSPLCTIDDRLIAAGYQDISLAKEMATLGSAGRSYSQLIDGECVEDDAVVEDFLEEETEEDEEFVASQIAQLEEIRDRLRGSMWSDSGALKTPDEYAEGNK